MIDELFETPSVWPNTEQQGYTHTFIAFAKDKCQVAVEMSRPKQFQSSCLGFHECHDTRDTLRDNIHNIHKHHDAWSAVSFERNCVRLYILV
jgi:hypothetical protein